jgi:two-component system sensor histidine kinase KdpD
MTESHSRPNPDALLAHIQSEEHQREHGRLKIFVGYAAGVGKTYAMLEAARQRKAEGVDVVCGYVETHQRVETEQMLAGLESIPRKMVEYRGVKLPEMDVDAVLARKPALVLVDELAHTNAPGSRHPKRYQDVEELLEAGIGVYSTLNIQHLESLNDIVAQITGVTVRETVPDRILDEAAEIELVDLPPEELLQRLKEGKIYVPAQAARAIDRFFREGNLTALRELSMRRAAERVDDQMSAYMQTRAIAGPWPATEHLLVCLSPGMLSERLVRTGRRLADQLNAEWHALYVQTPSSLHLPPAHQERLTRMLRLAEELGARVVTLPGSAVADTILDYARDHNITKIIAGKPLRPRWDEWLRHDVVEQIIRRSGHIDVYVISGSVERTPPPAQMKWRPHRPLRRYVEGIALVAGVTLVGEAVSPYISATNLVMLYLLAVVIAALALGRGPSILVSILSVLAFDFFFVPPILTFIVSDTEYLLTFAGLLAVSLAISQLTVRVREQAEAALRRQAVTASLFALSRDLAVARSLNDVVDAVIRNVTQTFGREVAILLPVDGSPNRVAPHGVPPEFMHDENELAVATWAFQHEQEAGRASETLPAAAARYVPLKTARGVVGVIGVKPINPDAVLSPEEHRLLEAFASLAALAIERVRLAEVARNAQVIAASEKLQTALLNSISHDLRTPLVSVTGALSALADDDTRLDEATRRELIDTARGEAERLNRLVGNLLDMTRIEAGAMKVDRQPSDVQDVIGSALEQLNDRLGNRQVTVDVPQDLPLAPLDPALMTHVLINLIDNALKYSPAGTRPAPFGVAAESGGLSPQGRILTGRAEGPASPPAALGHKGIAASMAAEPPRIDGVQKSGDLLPSQAPIEISARVVDSYVEIVVADRGVGIPVDALERVFDKFYRVEHPDSVGGTGLGLSICKGIIEAHGGTIRAAQRLGGGTTITISLPLHAPQLRAAGGVS